MIPIKNPAMSVNSNNNSIYPYSMFNTRIVDEYVTPFWLALNIATIAVNSPGGKLAALIFNCHGYVSEGGVFLGLDMGTGIYQKDLKHFSRLRNLVEVIHITACQASAGISGKNFCAELARQTQATVYAADTNQRTFGSDYQSIFKGGVIDDYEGQVFEYGKSGESKPFSF